MTPEERKRLEEIEKWLPEHGVDLGEARWLIAKLREEDQRLREARGDIRLWEEKCADLRAERDSIDDKAEAVAAYMTKAERAVDGTDDALIETLQGFYGASFATEVATKVDILIRKRIAQALRRLQK